MTQRRCLVVMSLLAAAGHARGADKLVGTQSELISALGSAQPGDNVILKNGVWPGLNIGTRTIDGTSAAPINLLASNFGFSAATPTQPLGSLVPEPAAFVALASLLLCRQYPRLRSQSRRH